MRLAIPKEILPEEKRVAATPETVKKYAALGFEVFTETSAGEGIGRSDGEYENAGARMVGEVEKLYSQADLVLKVKQPIYNETCGKHEVDMMREGVRSWSPSCTRLLPKATHMVRKLRDRHITAFTMDGIPAHHPGPKRMDALTSMSTVHRLSGRPAGCHATAQIRSHDRNRDRHHQARSRSWSSAPGSWGCSPSPLPSAWAPSSGAGTSAVPPGPRPRPSGRRSRVTKCPMMSPLPKVDTPRRCPEDWLNKEREALAPLVAKADIVILSALVPGELAPTLITDAMACHA
jgi:H+-translocating NAD(P) transhydrogenase subunit alpha